MISYYDQLPVDDLIIRSKEAISGIYAPLDTMALINALTIELEKHHKNNLSDELECGVCWI